MSIGRIGGGKLAVVRLLLDMFIEKAATGEMTSDEIDAIVEQFGERLSSTQTIEPLPRVVDGGFIRSEDFIDLVKRSNSSYAYLMAEADTLAAVTRVISYLVNGRIDSAENSIWQTSNLIGDLQTYLAAKRGGSDGIVVDFGSAIGRYGLENGALISKIKSSRKIRPAVKSIRTNGRIGNLLTLNGIVSIQSELDSWDIRFEDPSNGRAKRKNIDDDNESTIFEVEATKISDSAKTADYIAVPMRRQEFNGYSDVVFDKAPEDNELWLEITLQVPSVMSMIEIIPALVYGQKIVVDSVQVSPDGQSFVEIAKDFIITPETNTYLGVPGTNAGKGLFFCPPISVEYVTVRLKTHDAITVSFAHAKETDASGTVVAPVAFEVESSKTNYFNPQNVTTGGERRSRTIVALPGYRWSIPIRSIMLTKNEYEAVSTFQTEEYKLLRPAERVAISVDETIPNDCSVSYELSHDGGRTWTAIDPIERRGGQEIIVFGAETSGNPNSASSTYVAVEKPVTSLILKGTLKSSISATPEIKKIIIQPSSSGS